MFTIASAPAKQSVGETITTLSARLTSSTLLEDRRAAILGLRSFAKEYPASVASDSLRGLISSLTKDGEDVDTVKIVLETLLMLFSPNKNSPEASEEIALWLADEFTQRQDNITLLLDFLETPDFYSRLYSLQLLLAIHTSRSERTEECILIAPLGISRLVAVLDDKREAIRNEGLSLLINLTPKSFELQKVVAYENAFDRVFAIIHHEGGLSQGDRVVEDCLIFLANLLRLNVSNQSFFRETGCVAKLARLLSEVMTEEDNDAGEVALWAQLQKNRNLYALLAVIRLFLVIGSIGTQANQSSFWQHGILRQVLSLAFDRSTETQIQSEALITCADLIRGNSVLQEGFAQLQVPSVLDEPLVNENGAPQHNGIPKVYVIDGLLDLTLSIPSLAAFDSRMAACECIKAYFFNHPAIRKHFLRRAIDGHTSGADETANVLTTLLQPLDGSASSDPYRYWFAAVILFHLIFEDSEAKNLAMSIAEGDTSNGEEVITCIQTIAENLIIGIHKNVDERVLVAYLMLLCGWLFEDPDGVNDFLGEGSNVQSLVQASLNPGSDGSIVQGLCAVLLGVVYEFSTKDSPIPRATIHPILVSRMGRDKYIDKMSKLRTHPSLRDFEVIPQKLSSAPLAGLPEVLFDKTFVDFIKDNFSRLLRAIDREPGFEISVVANGVQKGISRELVDTLKAQVEEKGKALQKAEEDMLSLSRQLGQEKSDHRREIEKAAVELSRIKHINEGLQRNHEEDMNKLRVEREQMIQNHQKELEQSHQAADAKAERVKQDHQRQIEYLQSTAEASTERTRKRTDAEIADLRSSVSKLETDLTKANKDHLQDLKTANEEYMVNRSEQAARLERAEEKAQSLTLQLDAANTRIETIEKGLLEKGKEKDAVQTELDDLLMVFGDLEEKVTRYRERLKKLGETVSDGEEDEGEDEDDDVE